MPDFNATTSTTTNVTITWDGTMDEATSCLKNLKAAKIALGTSDPDINKCVQDFIDVFKRVVKGG